MAPEKGSTKTKHRTRRYTSQLPEAVAKLVAASEAERLAPGHVVEGAAGLEREQWRWRGQPDLPCG